MNRWNCGLARDDRQIKAVCRSEGADTRGFITAHSTFQHERVEGSSKQHGVAFHPVGKKLEGKQ